MWNIGLSHWWEFVVRAIIVYAFLLVILRLTGKRQVGQLAPFDLVLLLVLSNAVQNAMNGGDNSVTGGMILTMTLVGLHWIVAWLTYQNKTIEGLIEGRPVLLIHNGHIDRRAVRKVQMTMHELEAALRAEGCACARDVRFAVLENSGRVSVVMKDKDTLHTAAS
jgi:uncharacterized membrane protein YcaP (DUF421 family)